MMEDASLLPESIYRHLSTTAVKMTTFKEMWYVVSISIISSLPLYISFYLTQEAWNFFMVRMKYS